MSWNLATMSGIVGMVVAFGGIVARAAEQPEPSVLPKEAIERELPVRPGDEITRAVGYYVNDVLVAKRSYRKDGSLCGETLHKGHKKQGLERYWFDNGRLRSECPFVDDNLHGTCKQWNQAGRLLGTYDMNKGTGVVKVWSEDGTLINEAPHRDGLVDGISKSYYPDGKLKQECGKQEGRNHGVLLIWDKNGALTQATPIFFVKSIQKTREEYLEARKKDPTLPPPPE
jgi:antitoxin component YwqK of YwqJK toxin-antitoxin module